MSLYTFNCKNTIICNCKTLYTENKCFKIQKPLLNGYSYVYIICLFYRGRVRGGATYTTASSNDIDRGTPLAGYVNFDF